MGTDTVRLWPPAYLSPEALIKESSLTHVRFLTLISGTFLNPRLLETLGEYSSG